jgi:hypothetical protein
VQGTIRSLERTSPNHPPKRVNSSSMLEPRRGRVALILAFGCTVAASYLWYRVQRVPTLLIPVVLSALPLMATTRRQGVALRLVAGVLLVLWVGLGALQLARGTCLQSRQCSSPTS